MAARSYCFTSYKLEDVAAKLTPDDPPDAVAYFCYGLEVCPTTSRAHLQGYIRFKRPVRLAQAKESIGDGAVHLERRRGSEAQAVDYCKKDARPEAESGQVGHFTEWGERSRQGRRTDIEFVRTTIADGGGMRTIIDGAPSLPAVLAAPRILTYCEAGRPRDGPAPEVHWFWGPTGTGKTRAAFDEAERDRPGSEVWISADTFKWFDGYDAHEVVLFDDFKSDGIKLPWMLRLLDRYSVRVPIKGGYRQWKPAVVYVTCPRPPHECFLESSEDIEQLLRRITEIREFAL